jgi:hypothetical protein
MAGLVPAFHVFNVAMLNRTGCPLSRARTENGSMPHNLFPFVPAQAGTPDPLSETESDADQLQPLILGQHRHAELLGVRQLGAGAGSGNHIIRFPGD